MEKRKGFGKLCSGAVVVVQWQGGPTLGFKEKRSRVPLVDGHRFSGKSCLFGKGVLHMLADSFRTESRCMPKILKSEENQKGGFPSVLSEMLSLAFSYAYFGPREAN